MYGGILEVLSMFGPHGFDVVPQMAGSEQILKNLQLRAQFLTLD
jgi:hypothetical protein